MRRALQGAAVALVLGQSGVLVRVTQERYEKDMAAVMRQKGVDKKDRAKIMRVLRRDIEAAPNSVKVGRERVEAPSIQGSDPGMIAEILDELKANMLKETDADRRLLMACTICSLSGESEDDEDPVPTTNVRRLKYLRGGGKA